MSEPNHLNETVDAFLDVVRHAEKQRHSRLLQDLESEYPALRRLLLGGMVGNGSLPAASIDLRLGPQGIRVASRIPALSLEATYCFQQWEEIWDTLNNDFDLGTMPWQPDWQSKKREEQKFRGSR